MATLPPPITATARPLSSGGRSRRISRRKSSAGRTPCRVSSPGTRRRAGRGVPVATSTASKPWARSAARSSIRVPVAISDAEVGHVRDVSLDHLDGQAVAGDGEPRRASRLGGRLEDRDRVAPAGQLPGGGEAGGAGADDGHPLAVRSGPLGGRRLGQRVVGVGDEPLEAADRHRPLQAAPGALRLAGRVAGAAEGPDQRSGLGDQGEGVLVRAAPHQGHVAVGLDPGRAGEAAGRGAGTLDQGLLRYRLGEGDVGGPARDHLAVELVGDGHRAGHLTEPAAGAELLVDEARPRGARWPGSHRPRRRERGSPRTG